MRLLQCIAVALAAGGAAALYHERSMAALAPPGKLPPDAFFGYSLAYDSKNKRLISSAPRADRVGHVYSCDVSAKKCTQLHVMSPEEISKPTKLPDHYFWLGATLKADASNLMVCAPRHTDIKKLRNNNSYEHFATYGSCYSKSLSSEKSDDRFELLPEMPLEMRQKTVVFNADLTDSFGWSIDFADGGLARVGSPAMTSAILGRVRQLDGAHNYNKYLSFHKSYEVETSGARGRVMTYNMHNRSGTPSFLSGSDSKESKIKYNFGYSIASGYFLSTSPSFAVSTTYGEIGEGKVVIFEDNAAKAYIVGDEVGAMFGASLCAAQLHSAHPHSARSLLLIGAPAHFQLDGDQDRYHTGMVYIYATINNALKLMKKIEGPEDGGFFGYAIANVGDMDNDKKDEIAIAAPYEEGGAGAVYVFSGAALAAAAPARWLQRLRPQGFRSFGLSLTAFNYADNGCNDLAIGAPGNDKVAVYHCLPVINVTMEVSTPDMKKRTDKEGFEFTSCLNADLPEKPKIIKAEFKVTVKITHASATLAESPSGNNITYVASIERGKSRLCRQIKVKTVKNGNYELPIWFNIEAKLSRDPLLSADYDPSKATLGPQSSVSTIASVFAAECRTTVCEPKLTVEVLSSLMDTYVTGSTERERLVIIVRNGDGDAAYRPRVRVVVEGAEIASAPPACAWAGLPRQRDCTLAGGLGRDQAWNVTEADPVVLDMSKMTSESEKLRLRVEVFWGSAESRPADSWEITVKVRHDASGVRLLGKSDQGEAVNVTTMDIQTGKRLQQTYTIININGTNWKGLVCKIWLKKEIYALFDFPIKVSVTTRQYSDASPPVPPCLPGARSETNEAYSLECPIGDLFRKDTVTVVIPIYTIPGKLKRIYDTLNATLQTSVTLHFGKKAKEIGTEVTTTLVLQQAHVPLWMILCAAAVGIILVLLLAFAMYECGCLRRKNKEKLDNLKTEVKRKSKILHRRSMRLSDSERASLCNKTYRELLDEAEVKDSEEAASDRPIPPDQPNQTQVDQPEESHQNDETSEKNHERNLSDKSDTSDQSSKPDQTISSMSDKRILLENSLKMQQIKKQKANCQLLKIKGQI